MLWICACVMSCMSAAQIEGMPVPEVGKVASLRLLTLNVTSILKDVEEKLGRTQHAFINELDSRLAAKNWRAVWGTPVGSQDRVSESDCQAIVLAKSPAVVASFSDPTCLQPLGIYLESLLTMAQVSRMGVDGSLLVIAAYAGVSDAKDSACLQPLLIFSPAFKEIGSWRVISSLLSVMMPPSCRWWPMPRLVSLLISSWHHRTALLASKGKADALACGDLDDMFRLWSTRWEQWLVDLAIAEEQHVCKTQRGRRLGPTKLSQALTIEGPVGIARLSLRRFISLNVSLQQCCAHEPYVLRLYWSLCRVALLVSLTETLGKKAVVLALSLDIDFDDASLCDCREAVALALRGQMSRLRQERAGHHVSDPQSVKACRFIKQGDCAQFQFVQRQDAIVHKHWDDIYMPPDLPDDAFVRAHVLLYASDVEAVPFTFAPLFVSQLRAALSKASPRLKGAPKPLVRKAKTTLHLTKHDSPSRGIMPGKTMALEQNTNSSPRDSIKA
eukprot:5414589-Amphidinium_carterae.1